MTTDPVINARIVADMRRAQIAYFRSPSKATLSAAKTLEKQVDRELMDILRQMRLPFDEAPPK